MNNNDMMQMMFWFLFMVLMSTWDLPEDEDDEGDEGVQLSG